METDYIRNLTVGDVYGLSRVEIETLLAAMNPQSRESLEDSGWKVKSQNRLKTIFTKKSSIWGK